MELNKKTISYRIDDVYLVDSNGIKKTLAIKDIAGRCVKHQDGWESIEDFHNRCLAKLGRVRRLFGIPIGWRRFNANL